MRGQLSQALSLIQAETSFYPLLAMFAESPSHAASSRQRLQQSTALARSMQSWRRLQSLVTAMAAACINMLEQLGALCATQTRKATVLQGVPGVCACYACKAEVCLQFQVLSMLCHAQLACLTHLAWLLASGAT